MGTALISSSGRKRWWRGTPQGRRQPRGTRPSAAACRAGAPGSALAQEVAAGGSFARLRRPRPCPAAAASAPAELLTVSSLSPSWCAAACPALCPCRQLQQPPQQCRSPAQPAGLMQPLSLGSQEGAKSRPANLCGKEMRSSERGTSGSTAPGLPSDVGRGRAYSGLRARTPALWQGFAPGEGSRKSGGCSEPAPLHPAVSPRQRGVCCSQSSSTRKVQVCPGFTAGDFDPAWAWELGIKLTGRSRSESLAWGSESVPSEIQEVQLVPRTPPQPHTSPSTAATHRGSAVPWETAPTQPPLTPEHPFCPGRGMVTPLVVPDRPRLNQGPLHPIPPPLVPFRVQEAAFPRSGLSPVGCRRWW